MKAGIVGGGIMGKVLALSLLENDWQVTLYDGNTANCSMVAAGLLTPVAELEKSDPIIFKLGFTSIHSLWEKIIAILGHPIYFKKMGSLLIAHQQDTHEMEQFYQRISHKISADQCYKIHAGDLEPDLKKFSNTYFFPSEGQIDSQHLLNVMQEYLKTRIDYIPNKMAKNIEPNHIDQQHFDMVFDCRGLSARNIFKELRSIRGELIWLHAPEIKITRPIRFQHPRYKLYLVPRPDNIYIIGASEIESDDDSPISVRSTLEFLTAAYYIHPGFSEARIIKSATHCRPTLTDHLPKIKYTKGLIAINGLYRHGFLLAPALADDILKFLTGNIHSIIYPELWETL